MLLHSYWPIENLDRGLCAVYFFYFALRGFFSRKPFLLSSRWFFTIPLLIFLPKCIPVRLPATSINFGMKDSIAILLIVLLLLFFWKILKGHTVVGITEESFRKSLLLSLNKSNLEYRESLNGIHLKSRDLVLKIFFWGGIGKIRMKGKESENPINKIVSIFRKELEKPNVEFDLKPFLFSFAVGILAVFGLILEILVYQIVQNQKIPF